MLKDVNKVLCIAHRGAFAYAPENTMKAFELAVEMKADMIEFDIRMTKDGHIVVIHDETIDRTSDGSGYVRDMALDQLKQFDFGEGEKIPTLEEVLQLAEKHKIMLNIELKEYKIAKKTVELIDKYGMSDKVIVSSFLHPELLDIKNYNPNIQTALLFSARPINVVRLAKEARAEWIHPEYHFIDEVMVKQAHAGGIGVNAWTVDDEEDMEKMIEFGVDGVITDVPDVFIEIRDKK